MKISFIGFGNMAQAIAQSLSNNKDYQLFAASPSLKDELRLDGIRTSSNNLTIIKEAELVFLAVKPAKMAEVLMELKPHLSPKTLVLSIAAGLSLSWLAKALPKQQAIVRCMPNTPIAIGKGATLAIANPYVTIQQQTLVETLFQPSGLLAWTTDEKEIDPFTALAGSGPAYVFLFLETLIHSATQLGLSKEIAKTFAIQTVVGALELAAGSELELSELRKKVTSPAGTTAAALDILQQQGFNELIFNAMQAACERAKQLGA